MLDIPHVVIWQQLKSLSLNTGVYQSPTGPSCDALFELIGVVEFVIGIVFDLLSQMNESFSDLV